MRIVYLHQYFVTPEMPGGTRSYEMARRLVAAGHQVDMITTDQSIAKPSGAKWRTSNEAGITVHWLRQPYDNAMGWADRVKAFLAFAIAASRKAATFRDADVIFATSTPLTIAIPAIYASRCLKIPYVFEVRDVWPAVPIALGALRNPVLQWLARKLEFFAYHGARRVVALAPGMGEAVTATGYPPERVAIIPNGCDNDIFGVASAASLPASVQGWLADNPLVLFAGTLGKANNVGYMADIAAEMIGLDPEVRFAIVGSGADRDAIIDRARRLDVLDRNLKLFPAVSKRELTAWTERATACVALFAGPEVLWKDAVQNKFFDALSAGKPVISNHRGWQNVLAEENDVGFAMDGEDPKAAALAILSRIRDAEWLSGVAGRARAIASGDFDRNTLAVKLERVLAEAVSDGRKRT